MSTLFSRIRLSKKHLIQLVIFLAIGTVSEMLMPTLLSQVIEKGIRQNDLTTIFILIGMMAGVVILALVMNLIGNFLSSTIAAKFAKDLREAVFHQITDFSSKEFDQFGTASLVTRTTSDITTIQEFMTLALQFGLFAPLMLVAGLVLSIATGGQLSLVLVIAIPLLIIIATILLVLASRYSMRLRHLLDAINRRFLEVLEGVRVIRSFNKEDYEQQKFSTVNEDYTETFIKNGQLMNGLNPAINLIFGLTTTGVLLYGAYLLFERQIQVGVIVANIEYITMILYAITTAVFLVSYLPATLACMKRVSEVLDTQSSITDGAMPLESADQVDITFKDVTFGYDEATEPVLKNLNFTARAGETTAIIGRTGSGKSSILKLIPRLHDISFGQILLNGQNIKDYPLEALRNLIGYVPQKNQLFSGTVASNLNFGKQEGSQDDWTRAAHIASATEFIQQKEGGYQAEIAQGGTNLSGGQRQRMAIARAVMKTPPVFLFDDSLSALDVKTDRLIRQNIKEHLSDATILIVAQRISSIIEADQILVIDEGRIVGAGTHKELLKTNQLYREIATLQLGKEALQDES